MKKWHIILILFILYFVWCAVDSEKNEITYINTTPSEHYYSTVYVEQQSKPIVVTRKPTIGECIVAPVDFVVCICSGVIKGIGYGTAYVAETITPSRLYEQDNWCCYCDAQRTWYGDIEHQSNCKYK